MGMFSRLFKRSADKATSSGTVPIPKGAKLDEMVDTVEAANKKSRIINTAVGTGAGAGIVASGAAANYATSPNVAGENNKDNADAPPPPPTQTEFSNAGAGLFGAIAAVAAGLITFLIPGMGAAAALGVAAIAGSVGALAGGTMGEEATNKITAKFTKTEAPAASTQTTSPQPNHAAEKPIGYIEPEAQTQIPATANRGTQSVAAAPK